MLENFVSLLTSSQRVNSLCQFPDVVEFSEEMASHGKIVIVAALDGTFQRQVCINPGRFSMKP